MPGPAPYWMHNTFVNRWMPCIQTFLAEKGTGSIYDNKQTRHLFPLIFVARQGDEANRADIANNHKAVFLLRQYLENLIKGCGTSSGAAVTRMASNGA